MNMNSSNRYGAHEFLEVQELLRKLTGDIELHAICSEMTQDQQLKSLLSQHIQVMDQTYHQIISVLQQKGINTNTPAYGLHTHYSPAIGLHNPTLAPPNPQAQRLSDMTIGTIILNTHKAGAMMGMMWATECADINLRQLQTTAANNCQMMAYEIWQYLNAKGYYQVPQLADHTMKTMAQGVTDNNGQSVAIY